MAQKQGSLPLEVRCDHRLGAVQNLTWVRHENVVWGIPFDRSRFRPPLEETAESKPTDFERDGGPYPGRGEDEVVDQPDRERTRRTDVPTDRCVAARDWDAQIKTRGCEGESGL